MLNFIMNNLSFFIFVILLTLFLIIKRKNVEVQGAFPFLYMILYKTKLGLNLMDKWAKKYKRATNWFANLSIFIGISGLFISLLMIFYSFKIVLEKNLSTGGGLVLPIKTSSGLNGAIPIFYIPFIYWILVLFLLVVVHEFAHGLLARKYKIKVKSSGFAFGALIIPLLPAAFVEPDEKELEKANWKSQIAIFGAGSTSNFIWGVLFLLIFSFITMPFLTKTTTLNNVTFNSVMAKSDLAKYNITYGEILSVNNISCSKNSTKFFKTLFSLKPNESVNITIKDSKGIKTYSVKTFEDSQNKSRGLIGISGININYKIKNKYHYLGNSPIYINKFFYYLWLLNLGIGIMNLLPIWITDGGQITKVLLLRKFKEKKAKKYYNLISLFTLILLIFLIWPSLLRGLLSLF